MNNELNYPAKVTKDGNLYVIPFRDVKEAITQCEGEEKIVATAVSVLKDVSCVYIKEGKPFPLPSAKHEGEILIELPLNFANEIVTHNAQF